MTQPTLEGGPYVFNVNNLFSESSIGDAAKRMLLELKNALVALGGAGVIWQVVASSDATSVKNIGDGSPDLWSTISDVNQVSAEGSPHSWIILENQTTGSQLCIDLYGQSTPYYTYIYFSPSGDYSTDGTTSNRPSSSDEGTVWSGTLYFTNGIGTLVKFALHVMTSANHKTLRWFFVQKDTSSANVGGANGLIEEVFNTPSQWTSTTKYAFQYQAANTVYSTTPSGMSPRLIDMDGTIWNAYVETSEPFAGWNSCNPTSLGYGEMEDNAASLICYNNTNQELLGGYPVAPIGLFRFTDERGGPYGRLKDIYYAQDWQDMYSTCPSDASRDWVKIGCYLVPWDGSVPLYSE